MDAAREAIGFLKRKGIPYDSWTLRSKEKFRKEIVDGDAVYTVDRSFEPVLVPIRWICVLSLRLMMEHPELGTLVLVERVLNPERTEFIPRHHKDSSMSEKFLLDRETGLPKETVAEVAVRCLQQEAGLIVGADALTLTPRAWTPREEVIIPRDFGEGAHGVELDYGVSKRFPGLSTFRQVVHITGYLDPSYYQSEEFIDPETGYRSFWTSVHTSDPLAPIPVEDVATPLESK